MPDGPDASFGGVANALSVGGEMHEANAAIPAGHARHDVRRVLIDAFNRDLSEGTGISTYSRVLYDAVTALGHQASWLFGRPSASGRDPVAAEVTFHDPAVSSIGVLRQVEAAGRLWRAVTRSTSRAEPLAFGGVVLGQGAADELGESYNAPDLFRTALYRHELMGKFQQVLLPDQIDLFHLTSPLPVSMPGVKTITSICDLVPLRLPNTTPDNKERYLRLLRSSAQQTDHIVTLSETSKADIIDILRVSPDKVSVIYLATDMRELSDEETARKPRVLARFGLTEGEYLLFVGAIEPKKNLRRLIEAYLEIDTDLPLVIVGRKAWMWDQEIGHLDATLGEAARKRLRFLDYTPRADLRFLFAGARALAFPSLYEGFGLPALEAMKMGCPVLTSDIGPLHEVCGEAAVYADPYDVSSIRKGLERLISDNELRARLVRDGHARAEVFSFASFVDRLGRAYQKAF